jgi:hypothetical protein
MPRFPGNQQLGRRAIDPRLLALQGASEVTPRRIRNLRYLFVDYTLDTERRELHRGADAVSDHTAGF